MQKSVSQSVTPIVNPDRRARRRGGGGVRRRREGARRRFRGAHAKGTRVARGTPPPTPHPATGAVCLHMC